MKPGRIARATAGRRAKIIVLPVRSDDSAVRDLEQCLEVLRLLRRARPLKERRGYIVSVTVTEFDRLSRSPQVGEMLAAA